MLRRVRIDYDPDPANPRHDADHLGTMVCWHRKYGLGDEQPPVDMSNHKLTMGMAYDENLIERVGRIEAYWDKRYPVAAATKDLHQWHLDKDAAIADAVQKVVDKYYIILPLYLYDHSGITIRTTPFGDRWDSGQVGFIYVSKADVKTNWGKSRITTQLLARVENILRAEVEEYDNYLTGQVYNFFCEQRETVDDEWVEVTVNDTWGSYYGNDHEKSGLVEALPPEFKYVDREEP